ncbi:MAG: DUF5680 domain-containing protein [bacterium]
MAAYDLGAVWWRSHDNYFGGEPYGGRQVVFKNGEAVWITVYYGGVDKNIKDFTEIYGFLMDALRHNSPDRPLRGPVKYIKEVYEYSFKQRGDFTNFFGLETIKKGKKIIYRAWHLGGLVDINNELV